MFYEFKCPSCRLTSTHTENDPPVCAACGKGTRRVYSFSIGHRRPFEPHFNNTVGKPISSQHQFKEELKRMNEVANAPRYDPLTGKSHVRPANYQPVDLADSQAFGVTEEGMDESNRQRNITNDKRTIIV